MMLERTEFGSGLEDSGGPEQEKVRGNMMKKKKKILSQAVSAVLAAAAVSTTAYGAQASPIDPVPGAYGYFVDHYKTNTSDNLSPETNAVVGLFASSFGTVWQPGSSWNNGTFLNGAGLAMHAQNMANSIAMTNSRTPQQDLDAYMTDRRNQSYSALDGLGKYEEAFKSLAKAETSLAYEIPADAQTKKYSDAGGANGNWADPDSDLGNMVKLVDTVRGTYSSGNPAKEAFQYMRPFRWNSQVKLVPALQPCVSDDPMTDGGFPSGHTNAGYLASLALAYAVPEQYQTLLTNASEIGNYRIIAGMHSSFDVMGGRIMATALAAAILNDPDNAQLKADARREAEEILLKAQTGEGLEKYAYEDINRQNYEDRLTYFMPQTGDPTKPMVVPKGAEVLLETRFPYLDGDQRRWVLYSTGLPSGYTLLDDTEGWGRLDLYAASEGYGSFDQDVTVDMNADQGGFCAWDTWANDIDGQGSLTKNGSGTLCLSGDNSFTGGVHVNGGALNLASSKALGNGLVDNQAVIEEQVTGPVYVAGNYSQTEKGELSLDINSSADAFVIGGEADLNGVLNLDFTDCPDPQAGTVILSAGSLQGAFADLNCVGLSADKTVAAVGNQIVVQNK